MRHEPEVPIRPAGRPYRFVIPSSRKKGGNLPIMRAFGNPGWQKIATRGQPCRPSSRSDPAAHPTVVPAELRHHPRRLRRLGRPVGRPSAAADVFHPDFPRRGCPGQSESMGSPLTAIATSTTRRRGTGESAKASYVAPPIAWKFQMAQMTACPLQVCGVFRPYLPSRGGKSLRLCCRRQHRACRGVAMASQRIQPGGRSR